MDEPQPQFEESLSEPGFLCRLFSRDGILKHWVSLLSGSGSILLAVYGAAYDVPIPPWMFWAMAGACVLAAGFRAAYGLYKRADDARQKVWEKLLDETVLKFHFTPYPVVDHVNGAASVVVTCIHGEGAQNCGVSWQRSHPSISPYSIALRCAGNNDLNAGEDRRFNVARVDPETGNVVVMGTHAEDVFQIPRAKYRVTLRAHVANHPAYQDREFILDATNGELGFYPIIDGDPEQNQPPVVIPQEHA